MSKTQFSFILRWKRRLLSRPKLVRGTAAFLVFCLVGWAGWQWAQSALPVQETWDFTSESVQSFVNPQQVLAQTDGRTNILLLGIGGAVHESPDLTDSILVVSLDLENKKVSLVSIPRDVWIPSLRAKVNTAYYYGNQRDEETGGMVLAKSAISEVIDQPLHYIAVLDFAGFEKVIDLLGGVDVDVQRTFDDYRYPIPGMEDAEPESARYEHLHFESGLQHMDGETALKFVRSRQAEGEEGTDLARSNRQKRVLLAVKDKLLSTNILLNKEKLEELRNIIGDSLRTDVDEHLYSAFARLALETEETQIGTYSLPVDLDNRTTTTATSSALLYSPIPDKKYGGQWVLAPIENDFSRVHRYILCVFEQQPQCLPQNL